METAQGLDGPLEDRLRDLILNNTESRPQNTSVRDLADAHAVQSRSISDQNHRSDVGFGVHTLREQPVGGRSSRKRLNQAQRRQMSAQLTIPIDPRAAAPQPAPFLPPHRSSNGRFGPESTQWRAGRPNTRGSHQASDSQVSPISPGPDTQYFHQQHHSGTFGNGQVSSATQQYRHPQDWARRSISQRELRTRAVNVVSPDSFAPRPSRNSQGLYSPGGHRQYAVNPQELAAQCGLLDQLCRGVVTGAEIEHGEIVEKENFRAYVEDICRAVIAHQEIDVAGNSWFQPHTVQLKCFGSLASGFATKAADMDLGLLSPGSSVPLEAFNSPIPRLLEKALLDAGFGARLLTRTRVPIIKLCEKPPEQLRLDLLDERAKFDQGLADEEPDVIEEDDAADDNAADETIVTPGQSDSDRNRPASSPESHIDSTDADPTGSQAMIPSLDRSDQRTEVANVEARARQLPSLKQSDSQSLLAYYGVAKRALRRAKGRDITHSNAPDFSESDYQLLDQLSEAFILGLHDQELRDRVKSYPSFSATNRGPNCRTLQGVFSMVEGERLCMLWEERTVPEAESRLDSSKIIDGWRNLQLNRAFGVDPLSFNKELGLAVERLRQIPSIQFMELQQDGYESASEYYNRMLKITAGLNASYLTLSPDGLSSPIVQQYVSGIRPEEIRAQIQSFVQYTGTNDVKAIATRHKSLHLAAEYERAVEENLYGEADLPIIQQYMELLRKSTTPNGREHELSVPASFLPLFHRIRELPDPSQLAPNRPRDRYRDRLEFPKSGVGVQCDINFSADLALQNTLLLRCYSYTDPRVRPMVLFVKHWAKARGINTAYRGTLCSYGYVLMVLHYLINVAVPFVCPNLQELAPPDPELPQEALEGITTCQGHDVRFWRNEKEIQRLACEGVLNHNTESLGSLLRGFFEYYAQSGIMSTIQKRGFDWGRDVLSLRTRGGLLSKQEKGWTGAKTVMQLQTGAPPVPAENGVQAYHNLPPGPQPGGSAIAGQRGTSEPTSRGSSQPAKSNEFKEVRHRYLFAIEDPFELEHNVARTVTHNGIVCIRDEFRRAWRIIKSTGKSTVQEDLLEDVKVRNALLEKKRFTELLTDIHGNV